jgi:RimJ/RimL family protein N-acetyltransferase
MVASLNESAGLQDVFTFKKLAQTDLPFFIHVRNLSVEYLHDPRKFTLEEAKTWFASTPKSSYWIADLNGIQIGYFRLNEISPSELQVGADLHPDFRGMGIGERMYQAFFRDVLSKSNYKRYSLRVLTSNTRAINLYKALGFKEVSKTDFDIAMEISASAAVESGI